MADSERRRRRLRRNPQPADQPGDDRHAAETAGVQDPEPAPPARAPAGDDREAERGLRGLVGSGNSQVSPAAAMRARDAARPTDADLAAVEEQLVIVRRNWVPREDLPRTR